MDVCFDVLRDSKPDGTSQGGICRDLTISTGAQSNSPVADSSLGGKVTFFSASGQQSLDDIGGEPLAGSGFENEEPESEFASTGEEN